MIFQVFAHIYFNHVIMAETACFEDFVDILEASVAVHFPALKRECERFICREVMVVSFYCRIYEIYSIIRSIICLEVYLYLHLKSQ